MAIALAQPTLSYTAVTRVSTSPVKPAPKVQKLRMVSKPAAVECVAITPVFIGIAG
mgnify:CR=1 FL=1